MLTKINQIRKNEDGQAIAFIAFVILVLVIFLATVINTGQIITLKIRMQNAVDAAALSGVNWQVRGLNSIAILNDALIVTITTYIILKLIPYTTAFAELLKPIAKGISITQEGIAFLIPAVAEAQTCLTGLENGVDISLGIPVGKIEGSEEELNFSDLTLDVEKPGIGMVFDVIFGKVKEKLDGKTKKEGRGENYTYTLSSEIIIDDEEKKARIERTFEFIYWSEEFEDDEFVSNPPDLEKEKENAEEEAERVIAEKAEEEGESEKEDLPPEAKEFADEDKLPDNAEEKAEDEAEEENKRFELKEGYPRAEKELTRLEPVRVKGKIGYKIKYKKFYKYKITLIYESQRDIISEDLKNEEEPVKGYEVDEDEKITKEIKKLAGKKIEEIGETIIKKITEGIVTEMIGGAVDAMVEKLGSKLLDFLTLPLPMIRWDEEGDGWSEHITVVAWKKPQKLFFGGKLFNMRTPSIVTIGKAQVIEGTELLGLVILYNFFPEGKNFDAKLIPVTEKGKLSEIILH